MGRKREKKDKAPQRNNYKAEDLLRICYPDNDGGDEVTVNTRRLAGSLPRPVPPRWSWFGRSSTRRREGGATHTRPPDFLQHTTE